jgi:SAM-dependent methyltransferase
MPNKLSEEILNILICPLCSGKINYEGSKYTCAECQSEYKINTNGQADLRLIKEKKAALNIHLGKLLNTSKIDFDVLKKNTNPEVDFTGFDIPPHLTPEMISYFPKGNGGLVLDLGCGPTWHKQLCIHAGFKYIGLDYNTSEACIKADAHALPFKDNSIDFILFVSVLQLIQHPFVTLNEAYRVLKPGGKLIGKVAFLEPFHETSYYHHSHMGILNSLDVAGFKVSNISPDSKWPALKALSKMALFPRMPELLTSIVYLPLQFIHRLWWKAGTILKKSENSSEKIRLLYTAGSFSFNARKPH